MGADDTTSHAVMTDERRVKELEKRLTKMRNENQEQKILLERATRLLEREIGEVVDIADLSKEESNWKGRAQKVEILKSQVKKLKAQLGITHENSIMTELSASASEAPTVFTGKITNAERKISQLGNNKREELEKLREKVDEQHAELDDVRKKWKAAIARRDTLEKQLKTIKTEFGLKIKMLLDKAENDDKLVLMLKQEIARLENVKGAKSQLRGVAAIPATQDKDIGQLKNQVRCLEIELE